MAADFSFLTHDELLALVVEQGKVIDAQRKAIALLQRWVAELEKLLKGKPGGGPLPGNKATESPDAPPRERGLRPNGFGRVRLPATEEQDHAVERCPGCGTSLMGGWVQRTREVLELPEAPLRVIEHCYLARRCPTCNQRRVPPPELEGVVMGQQRLGVGVVSLIAALRQSHRLPLTGIQDLFTTLYGLHLSKGAIVSALQRVAAAGAPAVAAILEEVRTSPVVHGDETGWRQNGKNGYVWSFSSPTACVFTRGSRHGLQVDRVLGEAFTGVLISDFYAGYDHYDGPHQRCWVHLLRDDHDLARLYPHDPVRQAWSSEVRACYDTAKAVTAPNLPDREQAARQLTARLLQLAKRHADDATAVVQRLCKRILRYEAELFTFVRDPTVPADNNGAERRLRPLVTQRKISGGTRSDLGTATVMTLATLFETWRVKGYQPLLTCRQLISSPQL